LGVIKTGANRIETGANREEMGANGGGEILELHSS
jgi:hypothetical protein